MKQSKPKVMLFTEKKSSLKREIVNGNNFIYGRMVEDMAIDFKSMEVKKSTEYFGLTEDELLEEWNEHGYTREECKLFDDGLNITFFDDMEELETEAEQFSEWLESQRYEVKALVETVNRRIAVVSI